MRQHDMSTGLKPPPWGAAALVPGSRDAAAGGGGGADGSQFFDLESDLDETFKMFLAEDGGFDAEGMDVSTSDDEDEELEEEDEEGEEDEEEEEEEDGEEEDECAAANAGGEPSSAMLGDVVSGGLMSSKAAGGAAAARKGKTPVKRRLKRKAALKKAPGAPKRFKSPYILFSIERRAQIKKMLPPDAKVTEIMSKIAETWRGLSEEERKHWQDKADSDRRRYDSEMSSYSGPLKVPRLRPRRDPDAPKRAMSAFLHFSRLMKPQMRAEHQELTNVEIAKILTERWKAASKEEKAPYMEKEREERAAYKKEMVKWQAELARRKEAHKQGCGLSHSQLLPPNGGIRASSKLSPPPAATGQPRLQRLGLKPPPSPSLSPSPLPSPMSEPAGDWAPPRQRHWQQGRQQRREEEEEDDEEEHASLLDYLAGAQESFALYDSFTRGLEVEYAAAAAAHQGGAGAGAGAGAAGATGVQYGGVEHPQMLPPAAHPPSRAGGLGSVGAGAGSGAGGPQPSTGGEEGAAQHRRELSSKSSPWLIPLLTGSPSHEEDRCCTASSTNTSSSYLPADQRSSREWRAERPHHSAVPVAVGAASSESGSGLASDSGSGLRCGGGGGGGRGSARGGGGTGKRRQGVAGRLQLHVTVPYQPQPPLASPSLVPHHSQHQRSARSAGSLSSPSSAYASSSSSLSPAASRPLYPAAATAFLGAAAAANSGGGIMGTVPAMAGAPAASAPSCSNTLFLPRPMQGLGPEGCAPRLLVVTTTSPDGVVSRTTYGAILTQHQQPPSPVPLATVKTEVMAVGRGEPATAAAAAALAWQQEALLVAAGGSAPTTNDEDRRAGDS